MARRVRPGEKLNITAAEYNRLLAAADAIARDRLSGGGGNRTHVRDAATVRVHYQSATTVPIGGIVGFNAPLGDPDVDNTALARFVRDATIQSVRPIADEHTGRFGVAIEPIAEDKVGRVVFAGVVAARVNGIIMPMSPTQEERHSNQSPMGRLKSCGDAMRIKRVSSGLWFESENRLIQLSL
jgi:hypothetical protein